MINESQHIMAVTIKELFDAGVHFGHRTQRWNPKMKPYIFEARHGIYLIDLDKTHEKLKIACDFLTSVARRGEKILFVGCKKPAQNAVREVAQSVNAHFVAERWLGGTLTNLATIRKSVKSLDRIDDLEKNGGFAKMPKHEVAKLLRDRVRMMRNLSGIRKLDKAPAAIVIVDTTREANAVAEARKLNIPIVALVDTNSDPDVVTYPIPANDDALRAVRLIITELGEAIKAGQNRAEKDAPAETAAAPVAAPVPSSPTASPQTELASA
jgi:small subunit ribosomal protein S2